MSNKLENAASPYLLQHKDNPVDWYPWCEEAFEKAKAEDKPIFLSIGYSTCHWCHVMAHESFEDKRTAEILNRHFVSIKVDREERPDIDSVYMKACQAFTGSGGWPMSIFMTWDKKPFFAGTYFPVRSRYGMPGFTDMLHVIASQWNNDRQVLLRSAENIIAHLKQAEAKETPSAEKKREESDETPPVGEKREESDEIVPAGEKREESDKIVPAGENLIKDAVKIFEESFDGSYGGFGDSPKFPAPHNLLFLLLYGKRNNDLLVLKMVEITLTQMRKGGIFDQIGYGFSRYSTDRYFLVPHFEKMLYDNALLVMAYSAGYAVTKKGIYLDTAKKTAEYVLREMTSADGGFYSAQDADSEGVEGRFYTFTFDEVMEVLGEERGTLFARTFDITAGGNFEGSNIPNLLKSNDLKADFSDEIRKLYEYRRKRTKLHLDDKMVTSWNSMMIAAFSMLYRVSANEKYLAAAKKAQELIEEKLCVQGRLCTSAREDRISEHGFLDDYAFYTSALLELYHSTLDDLYLKGAEQFCCETIKRFSDKKGGGYYLCEEESSELFLNPKETYDGAIPSGNSVMAYNLVRLYQLTGNETYRKLADGQLAFLSRQAEAYPAGHSMFLLAKLMYEEPPEHITVVLKQGSDLKESLTDIKAELPFWANIAVETENERYPLVNDRTTYYVCREHMCLPGSNEIGTDAAVLPYRTMF